MNPILIQAYECQSCKQLFHQNEFDKAKKCCLCMECGKNYKSKLIDLSLCNICYLKTELEGISETLKENQIRYDQIKIELQSLQSDKKESESEEKCICNFFARSYYAPDEICEKCYKNGFICNEKFSCK